MYSFLPDPAPHADAPSDIRLLHAHQQKHCGQYYGDEITDIKGWEEEGTEEVEAKPEIKNSLAMNCLKL